MHNIPAWKLKKIFSCDVVLHKVTETLIDDEFGQTEVSEEDFNIKAEIQSITLEDMLYLPAGEVKEGDAFGYFLPTYVIEGEDITIEVNDSLTFKGIKYLVIRIEDYYIGNETAYRRATLRRK